MKIYLKQNWSEQFIYGDKTPGFFVGREQEINSLKNIIIGNASSAVLIASVRGIGKTSFVHKTLSEIENIHPVFVNIGHALANTDPKNDKKKLVLVSLIRAIHFNKQFEKDEKLEDLYSRCFGKYREEREESAETNTSKGIELKSGFETNVKSLIGLLSVLLISLGLYINQFLWRVLIGFLGIIVFSFSLNFKKNWLQNVFNKKSLVIDDSTEYLEIEFENWLRSRENKKIVFVIDELDKIEEEISLAVIKEYKNLFNRSFAHFLFLASQKSFELVTADREKDVKDGGIFPTLFTHVIYLPLPKSVELKNYLLQIFQPSNKIGEKEKEELMNYLFFRSGNDFFDLKRNISDFISFDDVGVPFIETDKIKDGDPNFSGVSKLFNYVDQWFLQKNVKELKKYWKENSLLQKGVFQFLSLNYNKNFNDAVVIGNLKKLILFLIDIGIIKSEEVKSETDPDVKIITYQWTGKYNRDIQVPLLEEDKEFINSFRKMIKLANDLDDLPKSYKTGKFDEYDSITEGQNGENLSGINLYSFFSDYDSIYNKLQKDSQRISVTTEKIKEATRIINEQISNLSEKYFDIFINILNELFQNKADLFINENISSQNHNINGILNSLPNFLSVATPEAYQARVYGKTDQTKYVLIIRNFEDEAHIADALNILRNNTNLLIVNLIYGDSYQVSYPKVYTDKIGKKRKKAIEVKNFINFKFNDFRQFSKILKKIDEHFGY